MNIGYVPIFLTVNGLCAAVMVGHQARYFFFSSTKIRRSREFRWREIIKTVALFGTWGIVNSPLLFALEYVQKENLSISLLLEPILPLISSIATFICCFPVLYKAKGKLKKIFPNQLWINYLI